MTAPPSTPVVCVDPELLDLGQDDDTTGAPYHCRRCNIFWDTGARYSLHKVSCFKPEPAGLQAVVDQLDITAEDYWKPQFNSKGIVINTCDVPSSRCRIEQQKSSTRAGLPCGRKFRVGYKHDGFVSGCWDRTHQRARTHPATRILLRINELTKFISKSK